MTVIVHIGNPKAFSTSMQGMLASGDGDEYIYLGFRPSSDPKEWYADKTIAKFFNYDMRYTSVSSFDLVSKEYSEYFQDILDKCRKSKKQLWLSSENISARFLLEEIDVREKLRRLKTVIASEMTLFVVFRNVYKGFQSIYREYLKLGYTESFEYFCEEAIEYFEANFVRSLFPGHMYAEAMPLLDSQTNIDCCMLPDSDAASYVLKEHLSKLSEFGIFEDLPWLNRSSERGKTEDLLTSNRGRSSRIEATGMMENHRTLWHLTGGDDTILGGLAWGKLRHLSAEGTPVSTNGKRDNELTHIPIFLRNFVERMESVDRSLMAEFAPTRLDKSYDQLWII